MPKAKKLPSGSYRCQAYIGTDENGKRRYKSFTASTKKKAELMAAEFVNSAKREEKINAKTFGEAMLEYNETKKKFISPSTYVGYESLRNTVLLELSQKPISEITEKTVQKYIDSITDRISPKTIMNRISYINSVLKYEKLQPIQDITRPKKKMAEIHIVTDTDMRKLLKATEGTELGLAIRLAAFIPARRSEICALNADDFHGNYVTINKAVVLNKDREWVLKDPKSYSSYRTVQLPKEIIKLIPRSGKVISANPDKLYKQFKKMLDSLGMDFRFHDLRHYGATFLHAQGIPDKYIMQRGGWSNVATLQNIYTHCLPETTDKATHAVIDKLNSLTE